jgi:hypothetical protein
MLSRPERPSRAVSLCSTISAGVSAPRGSAISSSLSPQAWGLARGGRWEFNMALSPFLLAPRRSVRSRKEVDSLEPPTLVATPWRNNTRTPPPAANDMLRSSNPETSPNPSCAPMNPPAAAPTMPRTMVTIIPPGTLPGMRYLAMAPAIRPNSTHNRMPMVDFPFQGTEFWVDLAAPPGLVRRAVPVRAPVRLTGHRAPSRGARRRAPRSYRGGRVGAPPPDVARHVGEGVAAGGERADGRRPAGVVFLGVPSCLMNQTCVSRRR